MRQLAMSYELPTEVMQNVQNAYMSGEHLLNLVNDILDESKIQYRALCYQPLVMGLPCVGR